MKNNLPTTAHIKGIRYHNQPSKVWLDGKFLNLQSSLKHANHSPTGFEWGYGGSGPTQLAFEICRQLYGLEIAGKAKAGFRHRFLEAIAEDNFDLELDLRDFNRDYVRPFLAATHDGDIYDTDNGPTGHGDICYSDADPGL
jgi:hypothetical protein